MSAEQPINSEIATITVDSLAKLRDEIAAHAAQIAVNTQTMLDSDGVESHDPNVQYNLGAHAATVVAMQALDAFLAVHTGLDGFLEDLRQNPPQD